MTYFNETALGTVYFTNLAVIVVGVIQIKGEKEIYLNSFAALVSLKYPNTLE